MKVVVVGTFSERTRRQIIGAFPENWMVVLATGQAAVHAVADAEVLIPEHLPVDGALLDRAPRLRLVQTGAGHDNVDVEACAQRGVWVAHARGVNARAVAEHVFAFVLSWSKNVIGLDRAMKEGGDDADYVGYELSGKTIGILGLGSIGRDVARLAGAFGMTILGCHRRPTTDVPGIALVDLPVLLRRADIVSVHVPLQPDTRHLIGSNELALMKRDGLLINTSRGPIVDEAALIGALERGQIGGAALDVFEVEPLPRDSPLRRMPNVILTPHTAGMPDGAKFHQKRYAFFVENIRRVAAGTPPVNALNPAVPGGAPETSSA